MMNPTTTARIRHSAHESLAVITAYALLCLIVTFPLILGLGRSFLGNGLNDLWAHVWGFWWVGYSLAQQHQFPLHTELINYPSGGTIFFIDPLGALLSIPLQSCFNLCGAYNILVILNLLFAATAMFHLARYIILHLEHSRRREGGSPKVDVSLAAFISGTLFAFSPHMLGQIENAISETFHIGWIALYALFFIRSVEEDEKWPAVVAGALLFITLFSNPYYFVFSLIFSLVYLASRCFAGGRKILKPPLFLKILIILAVANIGGVPYVKMMTGALTAPDSLAKRLGPVESPDSLLKGFLMEEHAKLSDLNSYFFPRFAPWKPNLYDHFCNVNYPGYVFLCLSLAGLFISGRSGRLIWSVLSVVFFIFSLGPLLCVGHKPILLNGSPLYLPYYYIFSRSPFLTLMSHPYRFTVMTTLCLAIPAGIFVNFLLGRMQGAAGKMTLVSLIAGVIMLELTTLAPVRYPITGAPADSPRFYQEISRDGAEYAILNVPPIDRMSGGKRKFFYYQTVHLKRIASVMGPLVPPFIRRNPFASHLCDLYLTLPGAPGPPLQEPSREEAQRGIDELRRARFRYVVLDRSAFLPSEKEYFTSARLFLDKFLGNPERYSDDFFVYRLDK